MALVFMEGFDYWTPNNLTQAGVRGWSGFTHTGSPGRFGTGQYAELQGSGVAAATANFVFPTTYTTLVCGFAARGNQWPTGTTHPMFQFKTAANATILTLGVSSVTGLTSVQNAAGTTIATGTTVLNNNTWHYFEIKCFVNGASGTVEVHLDGNSSSPEITSTVGNFGSTAIAELLFGCGTGTNLIDLDDIFCCDTTGSVNTSFLGDSRIVTIQPNGAGSHTQWTPLSGANWTNVDDSTPDDDTTYNSTTGVNNIDSFTTGGVTSTYNVLGVQTHLYARKDDTTLRQVADLIRQGGTDYVGQTNTMSPNYNFFNNIYNQDPTGGGWTAANVNADEFGYKLIT